MRLREVPDTAEFAQHLSSCVECQESLAVRRWLQEFAAIPLEGPSPPDPTFLWLKGQTLRQWEQERRSTVLAERMQAGLGIVGASALFAWLWRQLSTTGGSVVTSGADVSLALPILLVISMFVLIVTVCAARDPVAQ